MNNRKCKLLLVLIALIMTVQLCGFSFVQPNIAIDTDKYPVYTYVTADDLIDELNRDKSLSKYKDKYIVLSGMFENRSKCCLTRKTQKNDTQNTKNPSNFVFCVSKNPL